MERLKFLFSHREAFYYNKATGGGMALKSYNPFTDRVTIRHSIFGLVQTWTRANLGELLSGRVLEKA